MAYIEQSLADALEGDVVIVGNKGKCPLIMRIDIIKTIEDNLKLKQNIGKYDILDLSNLEKVSDTNLNKKVIKPLEETVSELYGSLSYSNHLLLMLNIGQGITFDINLDNINITFDSRKIVTDKDIRKVKDVIAYHYLLNLKRILSSNNHYDNVKVIIMENGPLVPSIERILHNKSKYIRNCKKLMLKDEDLSFIIAIPTIHAGECCHVEIL